MGSGGSTARCGSSSSSSEAAAAAASSSSGGGGGRRRASRSNWVFQSYCLGSTPGSNGSDDDEQVCNRRNRKGCGSTSCKRRTVTELRNEVNADCYKEVKDKESSNESPCLPSDTELDYCGEASMSNAPLRTGSSSSARGSSSRSLSTPSRFLSHFRFIPGNISSNLSRASSSRSLSAYPVPSSSLASLNDGEDVVTPNSGPTNTFGDGNNPRQGAEAASDTMRSNGSTFHVSDNFLRNHRTSSIDDAIRDGGATRAGVDINLRSPRTITDLDSIDTRFFDRRIGIREPSERNVRFSRTLSVGRLRDRVLRQSSLSDFAFCPSQPEREMRDTSSSGQTGASATEDNLVTSSAMSVRSPSSISRSFFGSQDREVETSRSRESRYHDLLEHRSNFLERRRRIRSQVRALQRLGSRFENLSGHERSCILAGQNQGGRCTCRVGNRNSNSTDETNARASISRIVMLAEALFEVLDEIHQQSVVLSSQPSVSSIGSVPAPNDVVDLLPIKLFSNSQKQRSEEISQCYICLVEYEEGDSIRMLPCNHEFHRTCVDKWLKEIHRVCPLCRGDICRYDPLPEEN